MMYRWCVESFDVTMTTSGRAVVSMSSKLPKIGVSSSRMSRTVRARSGLTSYRPTSSATSAYRVTMGSANIPSARSPVPTIT